MEGVGNHGIDICKLANVELEHFSDDRRTSGNDEVLRRDGLHSSAEEQIAERATGE